jgi:hypothetical protein
VPTVWRTRALYGAPFLAVLVLAMWTPSDGGPTICPFALATGSACPGCGMSRAIGYLARGDLASALRFHPLVFLIAIQAIAGWVWLVLRRKDRVKPMSSRLLTAVTVGTAVSLFAVWILRAVAGTLPPV